MRDTDWRGRGAETQAEGEAGSMQGAGCWTWSWILGSWPELKAGAHLLSYPGVKPGIFLSDPMICWHQDLQLRKILTKIRKSKICQYNLGKSGISIINVFSLNKVQQNTKSCVPRSLGLHLWFLYYLRWNVPGNPTFQCAPRIAQWGSLIQQTKNLFCGILTRICKISS